MKKTFLLLLAICLLPGFSRLKAQVQVADSLALVDIYNAGDGSNWTSATNWLTGPVNTWQHVTVTGDRVTELTINQANMGGTLSPSIGQLTELTRFEIQDAPNLTGPVPAELWNCTKITRLQIKFTGMTGQLPSAGLANMTALGEINFQQTYLGGTIPEEVFTLPALTKAYLHESNFTGTVPATVANATQLTRLYLQSNKLVGPLTFVNIKNTASKVQLTGNFFSFADVKQYHDSAANYALTDDYQFAKEITTIEIGLNSEETLDGTVAGAEAYAWFKEGLSTVLSTDPTYQVSATTLDAEGTYTCKAQSSLVANFDIRSIYKITLDITDRQRDSLALVAIYNAGDGANWTSATNWLTGPIDTWQYVTFANGRVTELTINQANMGGTLSPAIGQLTELTRFEIQDAPNLTGPVPAELWNCTKIGRLQIKFTGMTGQLPSAGLANMTSMYEINFQQTYLGGTIPEEVFNLPALKKAYLHESNFTGTVVPSIANATQLERLYLQSNKLVGPLTFVDIKNTAAKVQLTGNFFTFADVKQYHDSAAYYTFSDDYQYAKEKVVAILAEGSEYTLTGTATGGEAYAWFKDEATAPISTDETLVISDFSFDDEGTYVCKAQSSLVANFDIRSVYELSLNYTDLQRDSLALVDIYNAGDGANWTNATNWLTGEVSTWAGVVVSGGRVTELSTEGMNMGGTLSPSIGNLTALTSLKIMGLENPVTISPVSGSIPSEIWNLTNLKKLQIKFTNITGGIPAGIESMVNLSEINFQQTYLGGTIPEEVFNLPALKKAYLHESNFTGAVPATIANATQLERLYLQSNKLEGPLTFVDIKNTAAKVQLTGNFFTFADVKQYHDSAANYTFSDDYQYAQEAQNFSLTEGDAVKFDLYVPDGEAYAWFYNDMQIPISTDTAYAISSVIRTDTGEYVVRVQSSLVENFEIRALFTIDEVVAVPAFVSGASNEAGTVISVVFDYELADPSAETASFTFKEGDVTIPVTAVSLNGTDAKTIDLTLESKIVSESSALTITYTPGALKGTTGGNVKAFGPSSVANNLINSIKDAAIVANIYPNPCDNYIKVESKETMESVTIIDITGQTVWMQNNLNENSLVIETLNLNSGIYFLTVKCDGSMYVQKITKK